MLGCGIVGLPLSGKTTVFNVITGSGAEVKPYAGGKTDPNRAIVEVPDDLKQGVTVPGDEPGEEAKAEGYRSRAAYKLLELDERFGLLKGVHAVVDLGIVRGTQNADAAPLAARI